ncbi:MAG: lactate utilization protein [Chloroflexi bacterium]|nr:lactate utilization protein [Chloroflexota bacterium]
MLEERRWLYEKMVGKAIASLRKNKINAEYASDREEAFARIMAMIPEGSSIGLGDSVTLDELGVVQALREGTKAGKFQLFDRYRKGITPEDVEDDGLNKYRALTADVFLAGTNAITLDGKLVNVDGVGTRVAPIIFGPKKVIIAVGVNKMVKNVEEGLKRIREVAAPMNSKRHHHEALPCVKTGVCIDCSSPERICNYTVIVEGVRYQEEGRINVVIVGEELGL